MNNQSIEPLRVLVSNEFLGINDLDFTPGFLVAVRARSNQALQFTVLLSTGALFTGLPAHAIKFAPVPTLPLSDCQMWDNISDSIEVFCIEPLRYMKCSVKLNSGTILYGEYLFTIDFVGSGYSRDPEHWKQLSAIKTDCGLFILYPQYRLQFLDSALCINNNCLPAYSANTTQWKVGN